MLRSAGSEKVFALGEFWVKCIFSKEYVQVLSYSNLCKCKFFSSYFSQLLEEQGPLDMNNKMFSEEYEFFPEETQQILEKAGGLKSFLLGCPRFVVIDNCIALKKVALRLKKKRKKKNIKAKVEEMSRTGEYLRAKLPLNPTAREFKPDVKSIPASDLSSAAASENVKLRPVPADSPKPASEAEEPKPVSGNSPGSVSEDEKPKEVSPDSPKPVSEDVCHLQVGSVCPKVVLGNVKATYWTHAHMITGYCTYVPFRGYDITQTPPAYINVIPALPQYTSIYTPLASISPEYQLQRSIPVVTSFIANDRPDEIPAVYFEGHHLNVEHTPGCQIASETQILQEISMKSQCSADGANTAHSEPSRKDGFANKWEINPEYAGEITAIPHAQMVVIQVRLK